MVHEIQGKDYEVYKVSDFPFDRFAESSTVEQGKKCYIDRVCTFDIETTTITREDGTYYGFMYIWQFCIEEVTCYGRTWKEYRAFIDRLKQAVGCDGKKLLVVYVHNLSFEFQFMKDFFRVEKVFARKERDVVYAEMEEVEYRCSYALSNMGLDKFLQKTKGVTAYKLNGKEFDYHKKRYPDTKLTKKEMEYCVVDVIGLCQAMRTMLEDDTLCTIPITSTGYVRREFREACLSDPEYRHILLDNAVNPKIYALCKEATRGGIAGSNAINTNWTIELVNSFDKKSSYPEQMMTKYFPMSKFAEFVSRNGDDARNNSNFQKLLETKCCLISWTAENVQLKEWDTIPYISTAKCKIKEGVRAGNGKLYGAGRIGMVCTEIDFKIINDNYNMEHVQVVEMWVADRGLLPKAFRKHLSEMFQHKTDLEDGDKYLYSKYKNKINSAFGMMLTDILNGEVIYTPDSVEPWTTVKVKNVAKELNKYYSNRNSFLTIQWGVYVTAHARADLYEGIRAVGRDLVLSDTDSVKCIGDHRDVFERINNRIKKRAETFDIKPYAIKGDKKVYLGVWEHENDDYEYTYTEFKTLGAKKYCYRESGDDELHITVSGLRKGADKWLSDHGGFKAFTKGTVVPEGESGRTAHKYNDLDHVSTVVIDGHEVTLGSNIGIKDVSYTFGVTDDWQEMIAHGIDDDIDMRFT